MSQFVQTFLTKIKTFGYICFLFVMILVYLHCRKFHKLFLTIWGRFFRMANQVMRSSVRLIEGTKVEAEARGFKVIVDEPEQMGGSNAGMTPVEMLLSALGTCLTVTISMFSKPFHVDIKELRVDVEGDLDPMGAMGNDPEARSGYTDVRVNIHIVSDAPQNRLERLIQMAEQKCPVSDTLRNGVSISASFESASDENATA